MQLTQHLAQAYRSACIAEIEALKPGNVHLFADGHGMVVQDFVKSASASSTVITQPELSLGQRIYRAVEATWQSVGCNTNLGIVLLSAPIIHAVLKLQANDIQKSALQRTITQVLENSTIADAQAVFGAINLAQPAGLGASDVHDVQENAQCTLLEAMVVAKNRDTIALQYSNGFSELFDVGLSHYQAALALWQKPAWATTALYLFWLASRPDSHVARKHGSKVASDLQKKALLHQQAFLKQENPKHYQFKLMRFDQELKEQSINPGTSADLTVATLLVSSLLHD